MDFEVLGAIVGDEAIAEGNAIRELTRLVRTYGLARWRKKKGRATVRLANGQIRSAEIHWYEGHGIGRTETKIKRFLD